jgi:hypothetical protein
MGVNIRGVDAGPGGESFVPAKRPSSPGAPPGGPRYTNGLTRGAGSHATTTELALRLRKERRVRHPDRIWADPACAGSNCWGSETNRKAPPPVSSASNRTLEPLFGILICPRLQAVAAGRARTCYLPREDLLQSPTRARTCVSSGRRDRQTALGWRGSGRAF